MVLIFAMVVGILHNINWFKSYNKNIKDYGMDVIIIILGRVIFINLGSFGIVILIRSFRLGCRGMILDCR